MKIRKIFELLALVPILLGLILVITEGITGYEFLAGSLTDSMLILIFFSCSAVFVLIATIAGILTKDKKQTARKNVVNILCILILSVISIYQTSDFRENRYYEFSSPDENYTVVANEWSFLQGGGVYFYKRVNPLFIEYLPKAYISTDDGYQALNKGDYEIEWNNNVMTVTLNNGNGIYKTEHITL